ncbi:MAG: transporter associated domain-containing protein, partial [Spirochaetales bacterium]|nr:transporter associated domain-containing protein [Spirochaetales bacterium]
AVAGSMVRTLVSLLFSEIIPKTFFRKNADTVTVRLAPVMNIFFFLFLPVSVLLNTIVRVLLFLLRQKKPGDKLPRSRDDFRLLMHLSSKESGLGMDDFRIIDDILDFRTTLASEAMIPLHKLKVYPVETPLPDLIAASQQSGQRFFPCYTGRIDNIAGYIDIEALFQSENTTAKQILKAPTFFPEVKKLPDLLYSMVENDLNLVFLCDEYGGVSGAVTHQQIASEIIGMIPGNIHTIKEDVVYLGNNTYTAPGSTDIEYLSHIINRKLKKENNETIGGYISEKLGLIPVKGTEYIEDDLKFTVLEADSLQIRAVRIEVMEKETDLKNP